MPESDARDPDTVARIALIDQLCDRFEDAWRDGTPLLLEDVLLSAPESVHAELFPELLRLEREYRTGSPQPLTVDEARGQFGGLGPWALAAIDEVFGSATGPEPVRPGDPATTGYHAPGPLTETTDATPRRTRSVEVPGKLGRYDLVKVLGQGGMGVVYLGEDTLLGRQVAVKVIRPANPTAADRTRTDLNLREAFTREARIGAQLTHPAIATVHDFGFHDDEPYIVFEYVGGETLADTIRRRGRLPLEDVRLIIAPLAQALHFAHARRVIHRDLKPANIRATEHGQYKILDLGLAREFREDGDWHFAGTPLYASPEQADGRPCDGRSDQYALALITFELLAGRRAFQAKDTWEILRLQCWAPIPPIRQFVPDVPESVERALTRALAKNPNDRFADCLAFAAALGCQYLSETAPTVTVRRYGIVLWMIGEWRSTVLDFWTRAHRVHLVLTDHALWTAYRGELRRWRTSDTLTVRSIGGSNSRIVFETGGRKQSFHFPSQQEACEWAEAVRQVSEEAQQSPKHADSTKADETALDPVVVLPGQPGKRYRTSGPLSPRLTTTVLQKRC